MTTTTIPTTASSLSAAAATVSGWLQSDINLWDSDAFDLAEDLADSLTPAGAATEAIIRAKGHLSDAAWGDRENARAHLSYGLVALLDAAAVARG